MKRFVNGVNIVFAAFFFAALFGFLAFFNSAAATIQDDCNAGSGSWSGADPDAGTCTFPANSAEAVSNCGADHSYTVIYSGGESVQDFCTAVSSSSASGGVSSSAAEPDGCRREVRGPLEERVTLALCGGHNGAAHFPIGACELKCSITAALPSGAARKLPNNALDTIYVRTFDPGSVKNFDTYTVCFNTKDLGLNPPTIYRFIAGIWTPITIGNSDSSVVCAVGSSEGAYYLGEPSQKK
jgi:hypothetical protein